MYLDVASIRPKIHFVIISKVVPIKSKARESRRSEDDVSTPRVLISIARPWETSGQDFQRTKSENSEKQCKNRNRTGLAPCLLMLMGCLRGSRAPHGVRAKRPTHDKGVFELIRPKSRSITNELSRNAGHNIHQRLIAMGLFSYGKTYHVTQ